jgi:hypothetical protein
MLGWWATASNEEPLRLAIEGKVADLILDKGWLSNEGRLEVRGYDFDSMSPRPLFLRRDFALGKPASFLAGLIGSAGEAADTGGLDDKSQLPVGRGSVELDALRFVFERVRYDTGATALSEHYTRDSVRATIILRRRDERPGPSGRSISVEGSVQRWSEDGNWLGLSPAEDSDWVVFVEEGGEPQPLYCAPLSPSGFGPSRGHDGVYLRHLAGDVLVAIAHEVVHHTH